MDYNINNIEISGSDVNTYIMSLIGKTYAILCVFEDCEVSNDFKDFHVYLDRLIYELSGNYHTLGFKGFLILTNVLTGVNNSEKLDHSNVKSLTFYCISILNKLRVNE